MTAFMEAAGYFPAVLSALHALGALVRLWQHRRVGESGPCGCAPPAAGEDPGRRGDGELTHQTPIVTSAGPIITVTVEGFPAGAVAVVTVAYGPEPVGRGRW
ncbi:hypothetical protein [Streptomyces sp. NRRL F-2747]|uniref:hypothetical protein n=1 Tax=Streptomyces sp. NRRL F-2747 TaxID=1463843 RepID=UPI0004CB6861|nr:hypothetical protein [Streptomyces sp. NRRL F-2747]